MQFSDLKGGISINEALEAFSHGCTLKETLYAPDHWKLPRFEKLRKLLSEPITDQQAIALRGAVLQEWRLDAVFLWLERTPETTWETFLSHQAAAKNAPKRFDRDLIRGAVIVGSAIVLVSTAAVVVFAYYKYTKHIALLILIGIAYLITHTLIARLVSWIIDFLRSRMKTVFNSQSKSSEVYLGKPAVIFIGVLWPITAPMLIPFYLTSWILCSLFKSTFKLDI